MTPPNRITDFEYTLDGQLAVLIARNAVTGDQVTPLLTNRFQAASEVSNTRDQELRHRNYLTFTCQNRSRNTYREKFFQSRFLVMMEAASTELQLFMILSIALLDYIHPVETNEMPFLLNIFVLHGSHSATFCSRIC